MKIYFSLLVSFVLLAPILSFGQGSLAPPAAPMPTMKTLDQVRPGIPIDPTKAGFTTPYNITTPGNYYLAGNIAVTSGDAIDISASSVTLDLNGFTISSTASPAAGFGIFMTDGLSNITIMHGFVQGNVTVSGGVYSGPGFNTGIGNSVFSSQPGSVQVSDMTISGCSGNGIFLSSGVVNSCLVQTVGGSGIFASVVAHSVTSAGALGIHANAVSDCYASGANGISTATAHNSVGVALGTGNGISANVAENCAGSSGSGVGLTVLVAAHNSSGTSSSGTAISVSSGGSLTGCSASGGATGINGGDACTISGCSVSGAGNGIAVGKGCNVLNSLASNCSGNGITVGVGGNVTNCTAKGNQSTGIVLADQSSAQNCVASANNGDGIATVSNCTGSSILNCTVCGNGVGGTHDGIHLVGGLERSNRVDGNNASNNTGIGIHQEDGPDLIVRNIARNNTSGTNYSPSSGTSVGPIGTPNTATSPWANFQ